MQLLDRMFAVEMAFLTAETEDPGALAVAFHPDVVVHEPQSLPYAGDWRGFAGIGALFRRMREVWSDVGVERMEAIRSGDTVFMTCTLNLTARGSGEAISQPFAEVLRFRDDLLIDGLPFYHDTGALAALLARGR
ncbi:nuclear transport factor 2 family protein [Inquilinus sp. Marseille-Q2685]|uniref:nuclear transport factor 2 family protein n=1 Tax=Inquilinus sp. Marseille-Q2685 TaxID=2866581 RepID=UPI001CE3F091|nr:nuclear transport factor 2 family protein [Inquilinus sp. Marseille-Q2685]